MGLGGQSTESGSSCIDMSSLSVAELLGTQSHTEDCGPQEYSEEHRQGDIRIHLGAWENSSAARVPA